MLIFETMDVVRCELNNKENVTPNVLKRVHEEQVRENCAHIEEKREVCQNFLVQTSFSVDNGKTQDFLLKIEDEEKTSPVKEIHNESAQVSNMLEKVDSVQKAVKNILNEEQNDEDLENQELRVIIVNEEQAVANGSSDTEREKNTDYERDEDESNISAFKEQETSDRTAKTDDECFKEEIHQRTLCHTYTFYPETDKKCNASFVGNLAEQSVEEQISDESSKDKYQRLSREVDITSLKIEDCLGLIHGVLQNEEDCTIANQESSKFAEEEETEESCSINSFINRDGKSEQTTVQYFEELKNTYEGPQIEEKCNEIFILNQEESFKLKSTTGFFDDAENVKDYIRWLYKDQQTEEKCNQIFIVNRNEESVKTLFHDTTFTEDPQAEKKCNASFVVSPEEKTVENTGYHKLCKINQLLEREADVKPFRFLDQDLENVEYCIRWLYEDLEAEKKCDQTFLLNKDEESTEENNYEDGLEENDQLIDLAADLLPFSDTENLEDCIMWLYGNSGMEEVCNSSFILGREKRTDCQHSNGTNQLEKRAPEPLKAEDCFESFNGKPEIEEQINMSFLVSREGKPVDNLSAGEAYKFNNRLPEKETGAEDLENVEVYNRWLYENTQIEKKCNQTFLVSKNEEPAEENFCEESLEVKDQLRVIVADLVHFDDTENIEDCIIWLYGNPEIEEKYNKWSLFGREEEPVEERRNREHLSGINHLLPENRALEPSKVEYYLECFDIKPEIVEQTDMSFLIRPIDNANRVEAYKFNDQLLEKEPDAEDLQNVEACIKLLYDNPQIDENFTKSQEDAFLKEKSEFSNHLGHKEVLAQPSKLIEICREFIDTNPQIEEHYINTLSAIRDKETDVKHSEDVEIIENEIVKRQIEEEFNQDKKVIGLGDLSETESVFKENLYYNSSNFNIIEEKLYEKENVQIKRLDEEQENSIGVQKETYLDIQISSNGAQNENDSQIKVDLNKENLHQDLPQFGVNREKLKEPLNEEQKESQNLRNEKSCNKLNDIHNEIFSDFAQCVAEEKLDLKKSVQRRLLDEEQEVTQHNDDYLRQEETEDVLNEEHNGQVFLEIDVIDTNLNREENTQERSLDEVQEYFKSMQAEISDIFQNEELEERFLESLQNELSQLDVTKQSSSSEEGVCEEEKEQSLKCGQNQQSLNDLSDEIIELNFSDSKSEENEEPGEVLQSIDFKLAEEKLEDANYGRREKNETANEEFTYVSQNSSENIATTECQNCNNLKPLYRMCCRCFKLNNGNSENKKGFTYVAITEDVEQRPEKHVTYETQEENSTNFTVDDYIKTTNESLLEFSQREDLEEIGKALVANAEEANEIVTASCTNCEVVDIEIWVDTVYPEKKETIDSCSTTKPIVLTRRTSVVKTRIEELRCAVEAATQQMRRSALDDENFSLQENFRSILLFWQQISKQS